MISPRIGFSYTLGTAQEIGAFFGQARTPRAVVRGGIGVFANNTSSGLIGSALDNTGLPTGAQQIACIGPAAPTPDWAAYASNPSAIPGRCADGTLGTVFADSSPNVTVFARNFTPQRSVRSNASWNGSILDARYSASIEGTYSVNLNQQRSFDLNFKPATRFTLADEGRPVFADAANIVPTTGSIASRDARVTSVVRARHRDPLRPTVALLAAHASIVADHAGADALWMECGVHVHAHSRAGVGLQQHGGQVRWASNGRRSGQGPHQLTYNLRYNVFDAVQVTGTARSARGMDTRRRSRGM